MELSLAEQAQGVLDGSTRAPRMSPAPTDNSRPMMDYLLTYSWAILLAVAILAVLLLFLFSKSPPPSSVCNFSGGPYCQGVIFTSSKYLSSVGFLIANLQTHAIAYPKLSASVGGKTVSGVCSPTLVPQGGDIVCNATFSQLSEQIGSSVSGRMQLSFIPCPGSNLQACRNNQVQNFNGSFTTRVSPTISKPVTITLHVNESSIAANGAEDAITAAVQILGTPQEGANVTFSQTGTFAALAPTVTTTDRNGVATTYISSNKAGSTIVTATFAGITANATINFTVPATVFAQIAPDVSSRVCTAQNGDTPVIGIDKQDYACYQLPVQLLLTAGSQHTFTCLSPVPAGAGSQYAFVSSTACGLSVGQSGKFTVSAPGSTCVLSCEYSPQYLLNETTKPPGAGTVLPGSVWESVGSSVAISESPNPGFGFIKWIGSGTGAYSGTTSSTSVTMGSPITEVANFQVITFTSTSTTSTSTTSFSTTSTTSISTTSTSTTSTTTTGTSTSTTSTTTTGTSTSTTSTTSTSTTTSVTSKSGGGCLLGNDTVLLYNGTWIPVSKLAPGDWVVTYNVSTHRRSISQVTYITSSTSGMIEFINGNFGVTPFDEPLYVNGDNFTGWIKNPEGLRVGWSLFDPLNDTWVPIRSIVYENSPARLYDIHTSNVGTLVANGYLIDDTIKT